MDALAGGGTGGRTDGRRWFVLMGCFIGMSVATPAILLVPMGLFQRSVTAEFSWSRTQFSLILAMASLFNAVSMPIAGYLVDRFGAVRTIAIGTVLGCGCYAALSLANSLAAFVGIIALAVMFGNLSSYPAFMSLAQRWFDKRLGFALAVTSTGLAAGIGGFSYMIAETIARHGWRPAFVTAGVTALIIGLLNLAVLVRDTDGTVPLAEQRAETAQREIGGESLVDALRTRDFWLYSVAFSLVILGVVGCNAHLPALLADQAASAATIASVIAVGSAGSLAGRLVTGVLLDRIAVLPVAGLFFFGQAAGILLLMAGLRWALVANLLLGLVQGAEIDIMGYVVARRFGRLAYSRIYGACFAITLLGAIAGPLVLAIVFDRTGSYRFGLISFTMLPLLAFGLLSRAVARAGPRRASRAAATSDPVPDEHQGRA